MEIWAAIVGVLAGAAISEVRNWVTRSRTRVVWVLKHRAGDEWDLLYRGRRVAFDVVATRSPALPDSRNYFKFDFVDGSQMRIGPLAAGEELELTWFDRVPKSVTIVARETTSVVEVLASEVRTRKLLLEST